MALNPFKNKKVSPTKKSVKDDSVVVENESGAEETVASDLFAGTGGAQAYKVLRNFYVSEKSSMGVANDQYTFKVYKDANKSEIKKEVAKIFNVKVKSVRVLNSPEKRRDFGRHPGTKSGFKKAIVVLEKGYTIGQVKP